MLFQQGSCEGQRSVRGFTLVELLVVVVIVGVLASTVVFNFIGADREQELKTEAERFAILVQLAREEAIARNEEWGVALSDDGYVFSVFDPLERIWVEHAERPYNARSVRGSTLRVRVDTLKRPTAEEKNTPEIILFSSGEATPFSVEFAPTWESAPWVVRCDGLSRVQTERAS